MSDEQTTSGDSLNPAADVHAPRQATPVMDVTPPPSQPLVEPEVVAAPPEEDTIPPVSDEIAEQIADDAAPSSTPVETPAPAVEAPAAKNDEQTSAVHEEIKKQEQTQAHEVQALPKVSNPGRSAAIAVVFATILLAIAAVFAYMSTQK